MSPRPKSNWDKPTSIQSNLKVPGQASPTVAGSRPLGPHSGCWGLRSAPGSKSWCRTRWFPRLAAAQPRGAFCNEAPLIRPGCVGSGVCWLCRRALCRRHLGTGRLWREGSTGSRPRPPRGWGDPPPPPGEALRAGAGPAGPRGGLEATAPLPEPGRPPNSEPWMEAPRPRG